MAVPFESQKTLRHLIIGRGNMGLRHGHVLQALGDRVDWVDLEFNPQKTDYGIYDSLLVCTPADTHLDVYSSIVMHCPQKWDDPHTWKPIFIEKPVITECNQPWPYIHKKTLVACNWRFCNCLKDAKSIICSYETTQKLAYLDLIHFLDLFWDRNGRPETIDARLSPVSVGVKITGHGKSLDACIVFSGDGKKQVIRDRDGFWEVVHAGEYCDMFLDQMKHWRRVVLGSESSINPGHSALDRTRILLDAKERALYLP